MKQKTGNKRQETKDRKQRQETKDMKQRQEKRGEKKREREREANGKYTLGAKRERSLATTGAAAAIRIIPFARIYISLVR